VDERLAELPGLHCSPRCLAWFDHTNLQLPFALLPLVHFASMPGIMGQFVLKGSLRWIAWLLWYGSRSFPYPKTCSRRDGLAWA
jgi:hypothetical protein